MQSYPVQMLIEVITVHASTQCTQAIPCDDPPTSRKRPASPMSTRSKHHRSRTLTEHASPHAQVHSQEDPTSSHLESLDINLGDYPSLAGPRVYLSQFKINILEKAHLEHLQKSIFRASILKVQGAVQYCQVCNHSSIALKQNKDPVSPR